MSTASAQQILNGGFEDWSDVFAFEQLSDWRTGNWEYPGLSTTTKVPGAAGSWAAHLQTHVMGGDTVFGYILLGDIQDDLPTGGVPFGTEVDALRFQYRCDLQPGDSTVVLIGIWTGGILGSLDQYTIGGAQASWTLASLPVNGSVAIQPDSVFIAFASSNPFNPAGISNGSWIELDEVQLTAISEPFPDALPNHGMEDWYDLTTEEADGWNSFNSLLLAAFGELAVTKTTVAHSGSFAARLETHAIGTDSLPGIISNGTLSLTGVSQGVPFSDTPTSLDGWFQYEPQGADTARIYALFTNMGVPAGSAYVELTGTVAAWTAFSAPVIMPFTPDTVRITISSGGHPGSVLRLDDIAFTGLSTDLPVLDASALIIQPNPVEAQMEVWIPQDLQVDRYRVFDPLGRVALEGRLIVPSGRNVLDVAPLASGRYVLELMDDVHSARAPFVKR